jgi:guanylate kinase
MTPRGHLIIIAAPSGTGKTSVIRRFLATHPQMIHSVSCTTRPMRVGDVDGRDYHFIDEATFRRWIAEGRFAEWAEVHDHLYGTPREPLDAALAAGTEVLLDLDVVGSLNLKKMYGDRAITIFLTPPSMEELTRRLASRGTDAPEIQALRLKNALAELAAKDEFDHQVVNDDLERACQEIEEIIR